VRNETLSRYLVYFALIIVAVVIIWGFTIVGSPSFNRKLSADINRIEDILDLSQVIELYFDHQKKLPNNLMDLEKVSSVYRAREMRLEDPTSKKPYGFKVKDPYSYELCAEFELTSKETELEKQPYNYGGRNWNYEVGHHCFLFEISVEKRNAKTN
jgi:hypothetical protein